MNLQRDPTNDTDILIQKITDSGWNPRYYAYAYAHGKTPDEMLEFDKSPGRCHMYEFVSWNTGMWSEFDRIHPEYKCADDHTEEGHVLYDRWLFGKVGLSPDTYAERKSSGEVFGEYA